MPFMSERGHGDTLDRSIDRLYEKLQAIAEVPATKDNEDLNQKLLKRLRDLETRRARLLKRQLAASGPLKFGEVDAALTEARKILARHARRHPRRWTEPFNCRGKKGDLVLVERDCHFHFRAERIIAADNAGKKHSTRIRGFEIIVGPRACGHWPSPMRLANEKTPPGVRPQFPPVSEDGERGCWTEMFSPSKPDHGVLFDVACPGDRLRFAVEFMTECDWEANLVGRRV